MCTDSLSFFHSLFSEIKTKREEEIETPDVYVRVCGTGREESVEVLTSMEEYSSTMSTYIVVVARIPP